MLSWLVGIHPTLADFMTAMKTRESPDKKLVSVWWALLGEWNKFIEGVCFMQFQVGRFEIPPDHVRLVFATFLVNLKFTSKLNRCILKTIYVEQITSLWSDSLVISAYWLVLEQILSTSFSHFVLN